MRMISEELVFNGVVDPDRVLFDRESGYFIAVYSVYEAIGYVVT